MSSWCVFDYMEIRGRVAIILFGDGKVWDTLHYSSFCLKSKRFRKGWSGGLVVTRRWFWTGGCSVCLMTWRPESKEIWLRCQDGTKTWQMLLSVDFFFFFCHCSFILLFLVMSWGLYLNYSVKVFSIIFFCAYFILRGNFLFYWKYIFIFFKHL